MRRDCTARVGSLTHIIDRITDDLLPLIHQIAALATPIYRTSRNHASEPRALLRCCVLRLWVDALVLVCWHVGFSIQIQMRYMG